MRAGSSPTIVAGPFGLLGPALAFVALASSSCGGTPPSERALAAPARGAATASAPCPLADAGPPDTAPPDVDAAARDVIKKINANDAAGLFAMYGKRMKAAFPEGVVAQFIDSVRTGKGEIASATRIEGDHYGGMFALKAERGEWRLELHLGDGGQITGLAITNAPPPEVPLAESKIALSLPVRGKWLVFWGGETIDINPHVSHREQRRAADLVIAREGKRFKTDGKKNDDYFAYGQDVLAAADGTVAMVVDGVPENTPGSLDRFFVPGNVVVIEHAPQLFGVYAHLQPGKIRVKAGTRVKQGTALGLCGNSGNASEPHVHFHLQDAPQFESAWGVEPVFANVTVTRGGQTSKLERYTFKRDDVVDSAAK